MNQISWIYIFIGLIISQIIFSQHNAIHLKIVNEHNNPIEGVYVTIPDQRCFWYSDSAGIVIIPEAGLIPSDTLMLIHISYEPKKMVIESLNNFETVNMNSDIKLLNEVIVKPLDPAALIKEVIEKIPELYVQSFKPSLSLHAVIDIFDANDSSSLIYYKGILQISQPNKKKPPLVGKLSEVEKISKKAKSQLYPIRVSSFAKMISLQEQGVINNYKKYNFNKYQYIQYRENEAIKVNFHLRKGNFVQTGYLIIDENTKAIIALQYSTQPMNKVMKSTVKGGIRLTDLNSHKVEVNYVLNADNKYEFESGTYYVQYTNRSKNMTNSIILNSHLKRIPSIHLKLENKKTIEKLFFE